MTIVMVIGVLVGSGVMTQDWIRQWVLQWLQNPVPGASLRDVQLAFSAGDLDHAIQYGSQLLLESPDNHDVLVMLVRSLIYRSYTDINHERDRQQALEIASRAVEQFPADTTVLGVYAFALQANGKADDAARTALRVIQRDENNIMARIALSLSYGSQGIFEAAIREGERAVEIASATAPDWRADGYRVLAIAYSDSGRYDDAARVVEQAITYHHRLIPLHFERALYAIQVGDSDIATAYYYNIIAFDDDNIKARFRLCELSSTLREREAAIDYCSEVTRRAPGWSEGWYRLGREYFLQGNFSEAQHALNRCSNLQVAQGVPIDERRFECWYIQGQAAEVLGDCDSLMTLYSEFQQMASTAIIEETWTYPPGGPPACATPTPPPGG